jgi:hypothetical protein
MVLDQRSSLKLKSQNSNGTAAAVRGDASQLPFASQTFSTALAILVLHVLEGRDARYACFQGGRGSTVTRANFEEVIAEKGAGEKPG